MNQSKINIISEEKSHHRKSVLSMTLPEERIQEMPEKPKFKKVKKIKHKKSKSQKFQLLLSGAPNINQLPDSYIRNKILKMDDA